MDDDMSICEWHGISCVSGGVESVRSIHLGNAGLNGYIPDKLFSLPNLEELILYGNEIAVNFETMADAPKLHYLNLDSTSLSTMKGIEHAPNLNLYLLHIMGNNFESFPEEIFNLEKLQVLYLSFNTLDGPIPEGLKQLESLVFFQCKQCGFIGEIPTWFGDFDALQYSSLGGNSLSGEIPSSYAK